MYSLSSCSQRRYELGISTYEDVLLSGDLLAFIHGEDGAVHGVLSLLLADAGSALSGLLSELLAESVLNVVADQDASSVGVLRISNFGMVGHCLLLPFLN